MAVLLHLVLALALGAPPDQAPDQASEPRPRGYWQAIAESGMVLPEGESAYELIVELSAHLGSTDPVLRDDYGYGIPANWIGRQQLLSAEELRALTRLWLPNLGVEIGDSGSDSVLLRSFSALNLSLLAAHDTQHAFLEAEDFEALLEGALVYLARERDLRGWVEGLGWCHSAAHTADLLKFLARSRHLHPEGQYMLLEGIANRMRDTDGLVFVHSEDERLAAAVVSVMARKDFDTEAFAEFIDGLAQTSRAAGFGHDFDPRVFAAQQNCKNLTRALYVHLLRFEDLPPELAAARDHVRRSLNKN